MEDRDLMKLAPVALVVALVAFGISQLLRRQSKPRSFRDDPIGAFKDHSEIFVDRAQDVTEDAVARLQESLDEIRQYMPEFNRKKFKKNRKELENRVQDLTDQAQDLLKELRSGGLFSR